MGTGVSAANKKGRYLCERCGGTGVQPAGCWTGKAYDSKSGPCELCDAQGYLGSIKEAK